MQVRANKTGKNGSKALILEALAKLPQVEQIEIHRHLSRWLKKKSDQGVKINSTRKSDQSFVQTALGQYILEEADASIDIKKVRKALAKAERSWAQEIIAEREER